MITIIRAFKDGGDLVALFPEEQWSGPSDCTSYQIIGQHGAADYAHCLKVTRPATKDETALMVKELKRVGYVGLKVRRRYMRGTK